MLTIPITRADFIAIGERFASEDLIAEIDRLSPIAAKDITGLATRRYTQSDLDVLLANRATLQSETAARREQRGKTKGTRGAELSAVRAGKHILRSGVTVLVSAIAGRHAPEGETEEETKAAVSGLVNQLEALSGIVGHDSVKLRTRLVSLRALLGLPELAPPAAAKKASAGEKAAHQAFEDFLAKIDAAVAKLPSLAEMKKGMQAAARLDTAALDEIDGHAYFNLKRLTQTGRAYWNEQGNPDRAKLYQLNDLHTATAKRAPAPALPAQPGTPAGQPALTPQNS